MNHPAKSFLPSNLLADIAANTGQAYVYASGGVDLRSLTSLNVAIAQMTGYHPVESTLQADVNGDMYRRELVLALAKLEPLCLRIDGGVPRMALEHLYQARVMATGVTDHFSKTPAFRHESLFTREVVAQIMTPFNDGTGFDRSRYVDDGLGHLRPAGAGGNPGTCVGCGKDVPPGFTRCRTCIEG